MNKLIFDATIENIGHHGEINTPFSYNDFKNIGIDYEDTVKVSFLDKEIIVPFVPNHRCVCPGKSLLGAGSMYKTVILMDFHSNFVKNNGIAVFLEDEDRKVDIFISKNVKLPITFTFELYEKNGYHEDYLIYNLIRTDNRDDYKDLTDEEFCNFRCVVGGRIAKNVLYRSSSPINNFMGRARYADSCLEKYGIKTIINLCDSEEMAKGFDGFDKTYYSKRKVIYLNTNADITSYLFGKSILKAMKFINENEGPYLIHCMEGQDRTGAACALFASLLSSSKNQLIDDYMKTYENFYRVKKDSLQYKKLYMGQLIENIASIRGFSYGLLDVLKSPRDFFHFLDLTDDDINKFQNKLSMENYV